MKLWRWEHIAVVVSQLRLYSCCRKTCRWKVIAAKHYHGRLSKTIIFAGTGVRRL